MLDRWIANVKREAKEKSNAALQENMDIQLRYLSYYTDLKAQIERKMILMRIPNNLTII